MAGDASTARRTQLYLQHPPLAWEMRQNVVQRGFPVGTAIEAYIVLQHKKKPTSGIGSPASPSHMTRGAHVHVLHRTRQSASGRSHLHDEHDRVLCVLVRVSNHTQM
jgi:hypothetical protein